MTRRRTSAVKLARLPLEIMKSLAALVIGLSLGGCRDAGGAQNCTLASAAYVGYIDLARGYGPEDGLEGGASLNAVFGGSAVYFSGALSSAPKTEVTQKKGKKKMRSVGNVEIPQSAFLAVLKMGKD